MLAWVAASALLCPCLGALAPTAPAPSEYQVKAAFLYNFAKFVEWPPEAFADASSPIVIGVVGKDPFGPVLDETVRDKTVKTRTLVVRRYDNPSDIVGCHILFICQSEQRQLPRILELVKGTSVLTVSEVKHFAQNGGSVNFIVEENKVRFEINVGAAERARLRISSQLLKLARIVTEPAQAP